MIVQINNKIKLQKDMTNLNTHILKAIERNFGGIDTKEVITCF